jgi:hypothetical protein
MITQEQKSALRERGYDDEQGMGVAALGEATGRLEEDADVFRRQNVLVED